MLRHLVTNWLREHATEFLKDQVTQDKAPSSATDAPPPTETCDVVLIFPSRAEAGGLVDKASSMSPATKCDGFVERFGTLNDCSITIVETSAGYQQLAKITRDVVQLRQPKWLLACGFAVALDDELRKGHLLMAKRIIDADQYSLSTGLQMEPAPGLHTGTLLTAEHKPASIDKKRELAATGALACDRQAAVVAEVGRLLDVPTMTVHIMAEGFTERPPAMLKKVASQSSLAGAIGAAAGALIEQPSTAKEFWHDKEQSLRLSDRLASFLVPVLARLST